MSRNSKGCYCEKQHRRTYKTRPAEQVRKLVWCDKCDRNLVTPFNSKKTQRQKAKRQIKKALNED
jgi:hypothetical protein